MKKSELKSIIKECVRDILTENKISKGDMVVYEMELPNSNPIVLLKFMGRTSLGGAILKAKDGMEIRTTKKDFESKVFDYEEYKSSSKNKLSRLVKL
jgi:hypothetical protein